MGGDGKRWELAVARAVAAEIEDWLSLGCVRLLTAGSVRRKKPDVGDIEILYIPQICRESDPNDMFAETDVNLADRWIVKMEREGILERRKNARGTETFGPLIKLMRHCSSGIPVDLFSATEANWYNYLVCRTGPAVSNVRIAHAARQRGWKWTPYGEGFESDDGSRVRRMDSERQVFDHVGLPYFEPEDRV